MLNLNKEDTKLINSLFLHSFLLENCYNYESQQGLGFCVSMMPAIKEFYKDEDDKRKALKRHLSIYNTTPQLSGLIQGICVSLEKQNANDKNFDENIINNIKVSLMGPLAGLGDSFFWGTLRIISVSIGISLASKGSILGPILFLLIFNGISFFIRYLSIAYGYKFGTNILSNLKENNFLDNLSKSANIVGLIVVGAMSAQMVNLETTFKFTIEQKQYLLQDYLNQIFPLLLPLLYTLFMFKLLKKGYKSQTILLITIAIAIIGSIIGIL